jgi:hypothetical protein
MKHNPNKTVCATAEGILISFRESNKYQFLEYKERFQDEQKPKYQEISRPVFNKMQQTLYAKTVYGLSYYTRSELKKLPKTRLQQLEDQHQQIQELLNKWKTEVMHSKLDNILLALFPKSPIVKAITGLQPENKHVSTKSFKELGINQVQIAHKLMSEGYLPENFFQLGVK